MLSTPSGGTLAPAGAPAGPWGMGTSLPGLTSLSPLQQDELGGPEVADSPLPSEPPAQGTMVLSLVPTPWPPLPTATLALVPLHPRGWQWHQGGTKVSRVRELFALALGCSGFGAPWLPPPNPLCCCSRVTPHPQEMVACVVALWWPKPAPSTLWRVYCWHEHSDLSGQSSPAQVGLGRCFGDLE